MKLILADESEVVINDYTSNSFLKNTDTFLEAVNEYQTIIRGMSNVSVISDEGDTVMTATGLKSDGIQIIPQSTGGFIAIYYFHGQKATTVEDEYSQIGKILMGVET